MSHNQAKYIPQTHLVQHGESLTSIASTYEGLTVAALVAANPNLPTTDPNLLLEFGIQLILPNPNASPPTHTVKRGETLYAIARQYDGVSVNDIVEANRTLLTNGRSTPLEIGWSLRLSTSPAASRVAQKPARPVAQPAQPVLHTVQRGDTLFSIARRYDGVSVNELVAANGHLLTRGRQTSLEIGWQLKIPGDQQVSMASVASVPSGKSRVANRPTRASSPSLPTPTAAERRVMDRVRQFDVYIREASQKFGISVEHIRAIIATESLGKADANNGHAFGLMQITPLTWRDVQNNISELRPYNFMEVNWRDPRINILFGTAVFKMKMKAVGVKPSDNSSAEIAVIAYNAGQGTVARAIRNAKASGSNNPTADALKAQNLKPAIKDTKIYKYYLTGGGNRRNPYINGSQPYNEAAAINAAVDLKFKEISNYPIKVRTYLAAQM